MATYPLPIASKPLSRKPLKRHKVDPRELAAAVAEIADDGFCPTATLTSRFPKLSHRDLVRARKRAVGQGLLLERRGPEGQVHLALSSEGWRALRSSESGRRS